MPRSPLPRFAAGLCFCAAFTAASWALYGYVFGASVQHGLYLPWVLSKLQPGLYPGDLVVRALDGAPTLFWTLTAKLSAAWSLESACRALWALSRAAAFASVLAMVGVLGGGRGAALVSGLLVLFSGELFIASPLAGDAMLRGFLDPSSFCWPFGLLCAALWLSGRRAWASAGLGLLFDLNPAAGLGLAAWLGLGDLIEHRSPRRLAVLGLFCALAAPQALRTALSGRGPDVELLETCIPGIYLVGCWPWERWLHVGVSIAAAAAVFRLHPRRSTLLPLLYSALLLWAASFGLAGVPGLRFLSALQFSRVDAALIWLALCAAGPVLWDRLRRPELRANAPALAAGWALCSAFGSLLLSGWGACALFADGRRKAGVLAGSAALALGCIALSAPRGSLLSLPPTTALSMAVLGAAMALTLRLDAGGRGLWPRAALLLVPSLLMASQAVRVMRLRTSFSEERRPGPVEAWARTTPPDTLFIVPPSMSGFRLMSRRPVYAEWGDFSVGLWDRAAAQSWKSRMAALGVDWSVLPEARAAEWKAWIGSQLRRVPAPPAGGLPAWGPGDTERLERLAHEAGARYIVAPPEAGLGLPAAFGGPDLVAYAVP